MATPAEMRRERLKNDCEEMYRIKGPIIDWRHLAGDPPFIEKYAIIINVRSAVASNSAMRETHRFELNIPANYPNSAPEIRSTDNPVPYNPNIFVNGTWCYGKWLPTKLLGDHVLRLARTLQFDPHLVNVRSPANPEAAAWYTRMASTGLFPTDTKLLPSTSRPRMTIRPR